MYRVYAIDMVGRCTVSSAIYRHQTGKFNRAHIVRSPVLYKHMMAVAAIPVPLPLLLLL